VVIESQTAAVSFGSVVLLLFLVQSPISLVRDEDFCSEVTGSLIVQFIGYTQKMVDDDDKNVERGLCLLVAFSAGKSNENSQSIENVSVGVSWSRGDHDTKPNHQTKPKQNDTHR
jgi:hypothetical protein